MTVLRHLPNAISIARILLVAPTVWALLQRDFGLALLLFFVAGVSDAVDGLLAKRFGWQSRLGGILDPLADKFLLVSTYLCLAWLGALPVWLVALVLLRDLVIVSGAVVYHFRIARFRARPTLVSKLNTLLQIVLALCVVLELGFGRVPSLAIEVMILLVAATTLASGVDYVVQWSRIAYRHHRATTGRD